MIRPAWIVFPRPTASAMSRRHVAARHGHHRFELKGKDRELRARGGPSDAQSGTASARTLVQPGAMWRRDEARVEARRDGVE